MELVFDDQAIADIENIFSFPFIGHVGHDPDAPEWVVPRLPYVVVYEVDRVRELVIVTAVFHGAQDREDGQR